MSGVSRANKRSDADAFSSALPLVMEENPLWPGARCLLKERPLPHRDGPQDDRRVRGHMRCDRIGQSAGPVHQQGIDRAGQRPGQPSLMHESEQDRGSHECEPGKLTLGNGVEPPGDQGAVQKAAERQLLGDRCLPWPGVAGLGGLNTARIAALVSFENATVAIATGRKMQRLTSTVRYQRPASIVSLQRPRISRRLGQATRANMATASTAS